MVELNSNRYSQERLAAEYGMGVVRTPGFILAKNVGEGFMQDQSRLSGYPVEKGRVVISKVLKLSQGRIEIVSRGFLPILLPTDSGDNVVMSGPFTVVNLPGHSQIFRAFFD